jgi:hypothetical protein
VETGKVDEVNFRGRDIGGGNLEHAAIKGARAGMILGLAVDFAGAAADAISHILDNKVFAHFSSPTN